MYKKIVLATLVCLLVTSFVYAGARRGKAGYAVRDDNAMKEVKAIKIALRGMEKQIMALQSQQGRGLTAVEQGKIEGRLTWTETQISKLWKWVMTLAVLIVLILIAIIAVLFSGGRKRSAPTI